MDDIIGAFLPYFKIKLEKEAQTIKQPKNFKIDNRKFKLKSFAVNLFELYQKSYYKF